MPINAEQQWYAYVKRETLAIGALVTERGYTLDETQPHTGGERYLMQAITTESGRKLILLGTRDHDGARVVIKGSNDSAGKAELQHERQCRVTLEQIDFAYQTFTAPEELDYLEQDGYVITVHRFIDQQSTFLERPLPEQFTYALQSFKNQEAAHATTAEHIKQITSTLGLTTATNYLAHASDFKAQVVRTLPTATSVHDRLSQAEAALIEHGLDIERYCGFLTHTDFVPHNFRIKDEVLYLLDYSSLRFGNKHEGWARFINFMTLYNPPLAEALLAYVAENRSPEEARSLRLMRLYRLCEIIAYYAGTLDYSEGNLKTLNTTRVHFWADILAAVLADEPINPHLITEYQQTRDYLRSDSEKQRQIGLH